MFTGKTRSNLVNSGRTAHYLFCEWLKSRKRTSNLYNYLRRKTANETPQHIQILAKQSTDEKLSRSYLNFSTFVVEQISNRSYAVNNQLFYILCRYCPLLLLVLSEKLIRPTRLPKYTQTNKPLCNSVNLSAVMSFTTLSDSFGSYRSLSAGH